jgi:hypothetical protein
MQAIISGGINLDRHSRRGFKQGPRREDSISVPWSRGAARSASSFKSWFLLTFFQRMFAHSATSNSGAISPACLRSISASGVLCSSTTHLTAMLASMTSVFTAPHVLHEEVPPRESVAGVSSACAGRRPRCRRKVQYRR